MPESEDWIGGRVPEREDWIGGRVPESEDWSVIPALFFTEEGRKEIGF